MRLGLQALHRDVQAGAGGWASIAIPKYPGLMASARAAIVRAPVPAAASAATGTTVAGYTLPDWSYFTEDINAARNSLALSDASAQSSADGERGGEGGGVSQAAGVSSSSRACWVCLR